MSLLPPVPPHLPVSSAGMRVPYNDLHAQYLTLQPAIDAAIAQTLRDSAFIRGPAVEHFEKAFAATVGTKHCVSCANGTDALYIAYRALGLQPGDEVITSAHSWIASSETITQAGGSVVFADTDPATSTIDPADIARKITPRTRGLVPVHLYGQPADMDAIMALARKHNLWVVEDCAQAHLAHYRGRMVGTFGQAATFSFYPGKNLGAMGDAGALVTNDDAVENFAAMFARHGGRNKGTHEIEGINSRLDGLQAAILNVKLPHLSAWTKARQTLARDYDHGWPAWAIWCCPPSPRVVNTSITSTRCARASATPFALISRPAAFRRSSTIRPRCPLCQRIGVSGTSPPISP